VFPVETGLRDPRSQKRDPAACRGRLEHPSVSPFDVADGTSFVTPLLTRLSESAAKTHDSYPTTYRRHLGWFAGLRLPQNNAR
jgi:hypothetical protein